jgi:hypothetical protein
MSGVWSAEPFVGGALGAMMCILRYFVQLRLSTRFGDMSSVLCAGDDIVHWEISQYLRKSWREQELGAVGMTGVHQALFDLFVVQGMVYNFLGLYYERYVFNQERLRSRGYERFNNLQSN